MYYATFTTMSYLLATKQDVIYFRLLGMQCNKCNGFVGQLTITLTIGQVTLLKKGKPQGVTCIKIKLIDVFA